LNNKKTELSKFSLDLKLTNKKIEDVDSEIKLLESRLDSLVPNKEPNGYFFNVSEMLNEKVVLEPEIVTLIKSKISKIKSINANTFMKLFEQGEYNIRLGIESLDTIVEFTDYKNLPEDIHSLLVEASIIVSDDKLSYVGDLAMESNSR
jgi:CII-binding regulator of phage lambda lysogenization HflD